MSETKIPVIVNLNLPLLSLGNTQSQYCYSGHFKHLADFCLPTELDIEVSSLRKLQECENGCEESSFWDQLRKSYIANDVNIGCSPQELSRDLRRLCSVCVALFLLSNLVWFACLSLIYIYTGSDAICYCIASVFSFSLFVQLVGLTSYKSNFLLRKYLRATDVTALPFQRLP